MLILPVALSAITNTDPDYLKIMEKTVLKLDSAKSVNDLLNIRNQFERISSKYDKEWLPVYYTAYAEIQMAFYNPKGENNEMTLKAAKANIDRLSSFADADKSEVNTLYGYYYNALSMINPAVNGQKYFNNVISSYEKAMQLNPENPRPVFLLALYESFLPDFIRSKRDFCEETGKAKDLYRKEKKTAEKPCWGEIFLKQISTKCDK
jgi:hypothetical protein